MPDPLPDHSGVPGATAPTPMWLKVLGLILLVGVVLFVVMLVGAGVGHGPRLHEAP